MKNKNELLAAIDIGTTKIVAIIGKKNEQGRFEVIDISSRPSTGVRRGVVLNIEQVTNAIRETVTDLEAKTSFKCADVYVGIAGQHIRSIMSNWGINRSNLENEITKIEVDSLIAKMYNIPVNVGEEIFHVIPQNYIVDGEYCDYPIGMAGQRLEGNFHIVIGQTASARNMEKCINRVGLNVERFILEPLASSYAVLTDDEMELGVALIDIGGGTTDIAVFYDKIIRHTAVIPFGGNAITDDLKTGCGILQTQAEKLKVKFGSAVKSCAPEDQIIAVPGIQGRSQKEISCHTLAEIIQARMEEIIDLVMYEIDNADLSKKLNAGIVITGGGALLKNLPQLIKFKTGLDVRVGYPNENMLSYTIEEINNPKYATAIGLLLQGIENLPETEQEKKETIISEPEPELTAVNNEEELPDPVINVENRKIKKKRTEKGSTMDKLKNMFGNFFNEDDAEFNKTN